MDLASTKEPHRLANVLAVCDRYDTGYDNPAVKLMGIDKSQ